MNTERAIREAVEEHYASLYDPNYVLGEEVRFCLPDFCSVSEQEQKRSRC